MEELIAALDDNITVEIMDSVLASVEREMRAEGKSRATIEKYLRDIRGYLLFAEDMTGSVGHCYERDVMLEYREQLPAKYAMSSSNSMIAGVNCFFRLTGHRDLKINSYRVQREVFRADEHELTKEEYHRLIKQAESDGNERLKLILQTLGSTGIRISELPFITVEAAHSCRARVMLKGKTRSVVLPRELCSMLSEYAERMNITSGSIFTTRTGSPLDRSNILHSMKELSRKAGVDPAKVFPHNLRHLFAVTYYQADRDVFHLADILGHSNINTTRIYTAEGTSTLAAKIENLGLL